MLISKINTNFKAVFGNSSQPKRFEGFAYDDDYSETARDSIRQYQEEKYFTKYTCPTGEHRLSEWELDRLIKKLTKKPKEINYEDINQMPVLNVRPIGNYSYRGSTLVDDLKCVKTLKKSGIKRVIDLVGYPKFKEAVLNEGMEYLHPNMSSSAYFWFKEACFSTKSEYITKAIAGIDNSKDIKQAKKIAEQKFVYDVNKGKSEVINFVKFMQKGYLYICCMFGSHLTDEALLVDSVLNPKSTYPTTCSDKEHLNKLKEFYYYLTPEDKKELGWNSKFDEDFIPKIDSLIEKIDNRTTV